MSIKFNGAQITLNPIVKVDGAGGFSASFTIPVGTADGQRQIIAEAGGKTATCFINVDTVAPAKAQVYAQAQKRSIAINWTAPADLDIASYRLYRKSANGDYVLQKTLNSDVRTFTQTIDDQENPLEPNTIYTDTKK